MNSTLLLAWRYLAYHRFRSLVLVACIALTLLLPLAVQLLVSSYREELAARADSTPLVLGRHGSRYDLVLNSLYFLGRVPRPLELEQADQLQESGLGLCIPLQNAATARGFPLVGTSHDYYGFRGLEPARGSLPLLLGDAVLGAKVAEALGLGVGDTILTDRGSLYDLSASYPLRLKVVGVLRRSDSADDGAVFCDLKTAWILEGLGHGHDRQAELDGEQVLQESEQELVLNAAVVEATEITDENIDQFHFHGELGQYPLTAALVIPKDEKSATLLKGRYRVSEAAQLLVPSDVITELFGFVLRVKRFFDANLLLVSSATALFLALVVSLSLQVRQRELLTLFRIGCARGTVFRLLATELVLIVLAGVCCGALLALLLVGLLEQGLLLP